MECLEDLMEGLGDLMTCLWNLLVVGFLLAKLTW
jgi:hypothetical protein